MTSTRHFHQYPSGASYPCPPFLLTYIIAVLFTLRLPPLFYYETEQSLEALLSVNMASEGHTITSRRLIDYAQLLTDQLDTAMALLRRIPGSEMVVRYIRSSYQNDPVRSIIELALVIFCIFYVLRRRSDALSRQVVLTDSEIDELVAEWTPEDLVKPETDLERVENERRPVIIGGAGPKVRIQGQGTRSIMNLASYNFYNFTIRPQYPLSAGYTGHAQHHEPRQLQLLQFQRI